MEQGEREEGEEVGDDGRGKEKEGEKRVTYAQWELTKHLVIKSKLTFW